MFADDLTMLLFYASAFCLIFGVYCFFEAYVESRFKNERR